MPPEETPAPEASQPVADSSSPAVEAPVEIPTAEPAQTAPEAVPAPAEAVQATETAPDSAKATSGTQPTTQTGQVPPNDPLPPKPDPIPPPSAAAPQAQPVTVPPASVVSAPIVIPPAGNFIRNLLAKASAKIQSKKKIRLEKIMTVLNAKNKITNDEVEKLLHVSDATATRYLSALAKEGKIIQVGKHGKSVLYIRTP